MRKNSLILLLLSTLLCCLVMGCGTKNSGPVSDNNPTETSSAISKSENMGVEYVMNGDGTYTCKGTIYKYKLELTGKGNGSTKMSSFIVLTNNKDLTFNQTFNSMISSKAELGSPYFVVLGMN